MNVSKEQMIVKSIRIPVTIDDDLAKIAKYEDRTVSKVIQRLLIKAVHDYFDEYPEART